MRIVHQCESTVGWQAVRINSSSSDVVYTVLVPPWVGDKGEGSICECKGYTYSLNGTCKHQRQALNKLCGWHEDEGPEEQTPENRRGRQCPRCGGHTYTTVEEDDEV